MTAGLRSAGAFRDAAADPEQTEGEETGDIKKEQTVSKETVVKLKELQTWSYPDQWLTQQESAS
jgi:hypothetical protein